MAKRAQTKVDAFFEAYDRIAFQEDLGYSTQLVTRACVTGFMPANWYKDVRDWCRDKYGREVPDEIFRWDQKPRVHAKQNANSVNLCQGAGS